MTRQLPGTVLPCLRYILRYENDEGLTLKQVTKLSGLNPSSVRASLWTLRQRGLVEKRHGLWFDAGKD